MNRLVVALFVAWLVPVATFAYTVEKTVVSEPYEVVHTAYNLDDTVVHLGELESYPVMYEFTIDRTVDLQLQLLQRYRSSSFEPVPFSLIAVRNQENGGVAEVGRLVNGSASGWQPVEYPTLGVDVLASDIFTASIGPGTYRVEVSTPSNEGVYALLMGSEIPPDGYFEVIGNTSKVQRHFGYSFVRLLGSSYVFYPAGIIFLLFAIQHTWKYRNRISHVS